MINHLQLVGINLVFLSMKQVNQNELGYLIMMPMSQIELLSQKQNVVAQDSKAAKQRGIFAVKSPITDSHSYPTDMVQVGQSRFVVTYSCGSLWLANLDGTE